MTAQQNEEAPRPEEIDRLTQEAAYWRKQLAETKECLRIAEKQLLLEQFRGVRRYAVGDVILVKKNYFGQERLVQARVIGVNLHYGHRATDGSPVRTVSYSVQLRRKDGQFNASSDGFWDREVAGLAPQEESGPVTCVCGYGPTTEEDLDEHVLASMHLPGDHVARR